MVGDFSVALVLLLNFGPEDVKERAGLGLRRDFEDAWVKVDVARMVR